jgi:serine/threonine protein kinase/tetratricopeptide (TPR) repeat protein
VNGDRTFARQLADRYRVEAPIGAGGMGAVYRGFDTRLERPVAIKLVRADLADDPAAVRRFLREARSVAALQHPGVVTVFDFGIDDTTPYLVMELLSARSLASALRDGPLELSRLVDVATGVLDALAAAHDAGIVHRDVKPDNILLVEPTGSPKLVDFGVAITSSGAADPRLTAAGTFLGTPAYMAPEQLRGAIEPHAAIDLYALGVTLYEGIAGRLPHTASSTAELIVQKLTQAPPPLATVVPTVPAELASIVDRALHVDPAQRWPNARAMRAALLELAASPALEARRDSFAHARTLQGPFASSAPVDTDSVDAATAPTLPTPPASTLESAPTALATPLPNAEASPPGVKPAPSDAPPSGTTRPPSWRWGIALVLALTALGAAAVYYEGARPETPRSPAVRLAPASNTPAPELGLRTLALHHDALGADAAALTAPETWISAAEDFERATSAGGPARWRAAARLCRGNEARLAGDERAALAHFEAAIETDPTWAAPHAVRALALSALDRLDDALAATRRAEQLEPSWWGAIAARAKVYAAHGDLVRAVEEYRRACRLAPGSASLTAGLAHALHGLGHDEEAARLADEAIALDADVVPARLVLAELALEAGDGARALEHAARAASVAPRSVSAQLVHAEALLAAGRREDARRAYARLAALHGGVPPLPGSARAAHPGQEGPLTAAVVSRLRRLADALAGDAPAAATAEHAPRTTPGHAAEDPLTLEL